MGVGSISLEQVVGEQDNYLVRMPEAVLPAAFSFPKIKNYDATSVKSNTKNNLETAASEDFPTDSAVVSTVPTTSSRAPLYSSPVRIEEQLLMEQFYASNNPTTSYNLAEGEKSAKNPADSESNYFSGSAQDSEQLDTREAEETFKNIQYAAITGNTSDVSPDERRRFDLWIKFNPALFKLFEAMYALTREVNYGNYM